MSEVSRHVLSVQDMDNWGWNSVQMSMSAEGTNAEDFGAVLELEELSGVDVVFDEKNPSFIQFKKSNNFKPSKRKKIKYTEAMSVKEMEEQNFIHVDTVLPCDGSETTERLAKNEKRSEKAIEEKKRKKRKISNKPTDNAMALTEEDAEDSDATIKGFSIKGDGIFCKEADSEDLQTSCASPPSPTLPPCPEINMEKLNSWTSLSKQLHPWILKGIETLGFSTPTQIQREVIPLALHSKANIVGAAPTGSGKTLAFGVPILNALVHTHKNQLYALILTPTRELALQVTEHLRMLIKPYSYSHSSHRVHVVPIVGGVAEEKQRRLLSKTPHVLVATPGRLYDLMDAGYIQETLLQNAPFLVVDEADKMLESGKFKELEDIIAFMSNPSPDSTSLASFQHLPSITLTSNSTDNASSQTNTSTHRVARQTFVFSATLPTATSLPQKKKNQPSQPTLKELLKKLQLHKYKTIDVTSAQKTASSLLESKILCLQEEKDAYLYYLLSHHPGKTLVFVNAITCLRRLIPLFQILKLPVYPLHAQMQQRQRFKNLERFARDPKGILMASDVASRGLDIPAIDHVIHYQVPLSSDLYVHRSGRTARANASGLSIVMVSPKESLRYKTICTQLGHKELPDATVHLSRLEVLKQRLEVAKKIETLMHQSKKKSMNQNWMTKTAKALEIELDDDGFIDSDDEMDTKKRTNVTLQQLRLQLDTLMKN